MTSESEEGRKGIVKTTVSMAYDLWEQAKIAALKRGLTLTQVVEAALRKWLELSGKERA